MIATCCNNPFDVVKSRMQAERRCGGGGGAALGEAGFARLHAIWLAEGFGGLYVGFVAKALRMGLGGAVGMAAYEGAAALLARAN